MNILRVAMFIVCVLWLLVLWELVYQSGRVRKWRKQKGGALWQWLSANAVSRISGVANRIGRKKKKGLSGGGAITACPGILPRKLKLPGTNSEE